MVKTESRKLFSVTIHSRMERIGEGPERPIGTFATRVLGGLSEGWQLETAKAWRVDPSYLRAHNRADRMRLLKIQGFLRWFFEVVELDDLHFARAAARAATATVREIEREAIRLWLPVRNGVHFLATVVGAVWVSAVFGAGSGHLRVCNKCERLFTVKRPENRSQRCRSCFRSGQRHHAAGFEPWVQLEWERAQGRRRKQLKGVAYRMWRGAARLDLERCLRGVIPKAARREALQKWVARYAPRDSEGRGRPAIRSQPSGVRGTKGVGRG
jgi:hypothetical protein